VKAADPRQLLTIADVVALAQVSKQTVWRATKDGRLRATRLGPQVVRFTREDVDAWINAGRSRL